MTYSRVGATNTVNSVTIVNSTINTGTLTGTTTVQGAAVFNNTATFNAAVSIPSTLSVTGTTTVGTLTGVGDLGPTITGTTTITDSSSGVALTVTRSGTGTVARFNSSGASDGTPIIIDGENRIVVNHTQTIPVQWFSTTFSNPSIQIHGDNPASASQAAALSVTAYSSTGTSGPHIFLAKSNSGTIGTHAAVASGNALGNIAFNGSDGTNFIRTAVISSSVDGTVATNSVPSRIGFWTMAAGETSITERMRLTSTGILGIGTTNPASDQSLQITSANATTKIRLDSTSTTNFSGARIEGVSNNRYRAFIDMVANSSAANAGGIMLFYVADASGGIPERMRIDVAGNVGIGVPNPNATLHVGGAAAGSPSLIVAAGGNAPDQGGQIEFRVNTNPTFSSMSAIRGLLANQAATEMQGGIGFFTRPISAGGSALTERVRISSDGNVSIGTTSGSKLNVYDATSSVFTLRGDSEVAAVIRRSISSAGGSQIYLQKSRGSNASPTIVSAGDVVGQLLFGAHDGVDYRALAAINAVVDTDPGAGDMPGRLEIYTTPDGSTTPVERIRINNAGLITGSGTSLGAWTAFTPTLGGTGWAIGDGGATGAYCQVGKIVVFRVRIAFGATSTYGSTNPTISLPVTAVTGTGGAFNVSGKMFDTSTGLQYLAFPLLTSTTTFQVCSIGTLGVQATTNATTPFTWANTDELYIYGTYQAA